MSTSRIIFYGLVAALIITSLYMARSGRVPDWEKCKESLVQQVITGDCTFREGYEPQPIAPSSSGQNI